MGGRGGLHSTVGAAFSSSIFHFPCHAMARHDEDIVEVVPLFGTDAPVPCAFAPAIQDRNLDDVEDLFRVHVATLSAGHLLRIEVVHDGAEMGQGVEGTSREDRISALVHDPQGIETPEDISARLVDHCDDQGSAVGHLLEQVHQQFGVLAAQATGRLIHQEHFWLPNEFHGDVQALALASTDGLAQGVPHGQVTGLPQAELAQAGLYPLLRLLRGLLAKGQSGGVVQVFSDGELWKKVVSLRDQSDARPVRGRGHRMAVEQDVAEGGLVRAGQQVQQGRFAGAAGAHDPDEHAGPCSGAERMQGLLVGYLNQWLISRTSSSNSGMFSSSMKERWMSTKCSGAVPG